MQKKAIIPAGNPKYISTNPFTKNAIANNFKDFHSTSQALVDCVFGLNIKKFSELISNFPLDELIPYK